VVRRIAEKLKHLWVLATSERASAREIGWAVAIGVFAGCTPAVGFHGPFAVALATILKKNRLFAWIGSRISNMFILPFIVLAEVQLAHRVRQGTWVTLDRKHVVREAPNLLFDWFLGTIPVGLLLAIVFGLVAWAIVARRDRFRFDAISSLAAPVRSSKPEEAIPVRSSPTASNSRQLESGLENAETINNPQVHDEGPPPSSGSPA